MNLSSSRIASLDGLRGLAAAVVVVGHGFNALDLPLEVRREFVRSPLAVLLMTSAAVQLFFVLSGYVLAASLSRNRKLWDVAQFLVRRIFRIHPPYVFAVVVAWLASFFYLTSPEGQGFSPFSATVHIEWPALLESFLFPGTAGGQLPVGWTLTVEMFFSLLFPVLYLVARRGHWALLVAASALPWVGNPSVWWWSFDFALGIAAYLERERLGRWMAGIPPLGRALWVVGSLGVLATPHMLWSQPAFGVFVTNEAPRNILVQGLGAVGLVIGAALVPGARRLLSTRPSLMLGRWSYSVYLLHYTWILLLAPLLPRPTPGIVGVVFILGLLALSTVTSSFSYRFVERPSIRVGNRVCSWISRRTSTASLESRLLER